MFYTYDVLVYSHIHIWYRITVIYLLKSNRSLPESWWVMDDSNKRDLLVPQDHTDQWENKKYNQNRSFPQKKEKKIPPNKIIIID